MIEVNAFLCLLLIFIEAVIAHRNVLAKKEDMSYYSYLRNDIIEQLTDRLLVI